MAQVASIMMDIFDIFVNVLAIISDVFLILVQVLDVGVDIFLVLRYIFPVIPNVFPVGLQCRRGSSVLFVLLILGLIALYLALILTDILSVVVYIALVLPGVLFILAQVFSVIVNILAVMPDIFLVRVDIGVWRCGRGRQCSRRLLGVGPYCQRCEQSRSPKNVAKESCLHRNFPPLTYAVDTRTAS